MAAGDIPQFMVEALRGTQTVNIGLKMPYNRTITFVDADGNTKPFTTTEEQQRFLFKLTGCGEQQHYKHCTPHALQSESDLWCPFCMYDCDVWTAAGKGSIVTNELSFMQLLVLMRLSTEWCHQVRHWWWGACIDFYNWQLKVYVQVDGHSHWYGVHNLSREEVWARDLRCNQSAFWAGAGLVRAHEINVQQPDVLMAAIAIAAAERVVVFTAGYKQIRWQHVILLHQVLHPYCNVRTDAYGNTVFAIPHLLTW